MKYENALNFIVQKQSLGIKPGLERILKLLEKMGNPQNDIKIIHIAGTNGKGTVAKTINDTLVENGCKVGLFTSPWVTDYREQIQINNRMITKNDFAKYVKIYKENDCSEFEFLTAVMYKYFADQKVDYAVVECGMGGRGDATNAEENNLSVITSISLDHTDFLGNTIEEIALEKAGIIKENSTCILYPNKAVEDIFEKVCREKNAKLVKVPEGDDFILNNLNTAVYTIFELGFNVGVNLSHLPARHEAIGMKTLLDGGHNVEAARALAQIPFFEDEVAVTVIGMMKDKDVEGYLSIVAPKCRKIIATTPSNSRAMKAEELAEIAKKYCDDVMVIDNPVDAVNFAKSCKKFFVVCGSFYLAREIRKELL